MEYFAETYIKNGKLLKTKKHFFMCPKCELVLVSPVDDSYSSNLCWICFLKSKRYYKSAIREVKLDWFTWSTKLLEVKLGWSFVEKLWIIGAFLAVVKMGSLNKTPKTNEKISDYWSDWAIKIAREYNHK